MMRASDYRAAARQALQGNWGSAVLVNLLAALLGGAAFQSSVAIDSEYFENFFQNGRFLPPGAYYNAGYEIQRFLGVIDSIFGVLLVLSIVQFILGAAVHLGLCQYNINLVNKQQPLSINTLFERFSIFGRALLTRFLISLYTWLWTMLFIVPMVIIIVLVNVLGVSASYSSYGYSVGMAFFTLLTFALMIVIIVGLSILLQRYAAAPYLLAQNPQMTASQAISHSRAIMRGHEKRLFFLELSFFGWSLLAGLTCGIGLLWLYPYINAARAAFYLELTGQTQGQYPYAAGAPGGGYAPPPYGGPGGYAQQHYQPQHPGAYGQQPYAPQYPPQYQQPPHQPYGAPPPWPQQDAGQQPAPQPYTPPPADAPQPPYAAPVPPQEDAGATQSPFAPEPPPAAPQPFEELGAPPAAPTPPAPEGEDVGKDE